MNQHEVFARFYAQVRVCLEKADARQHLRQLDQLENQTRDVVHPLVYRYVHAEIRSSLDR